MSNVNLNRWILAKCKVTVLSQFTFLSFVTSLLIAVKHLNAMIQVHSNTDYTPAKLLADVWCIFEKDDDIIVWRPRILPAKIQTQIWHKWLICRGSRAIFFYFCFSSFPDLFSQAASPTTIKRPKRHKASSISFCYFQMDF